MSKPIPPESLDRKQRVAFLRLLRHARAIMLADAEAFHEAVAVLEQIGQVLVGKKKRGFGGYGDELIGLAATTPKADEEQIKRQFEIIRIARNDAVHDGAYIRHLSGRLVDFIVSLEKAVMSKLLRIEDLMVTEPVTVESWQLVLHARKLLLANSFSTLPIYLPTPEPGMWALISDAGLMKYLRGESGCEDDDRDGRLSKRIGDAIAEGLEYERAVCCRRDELVEDRFRELRSTPLLVTEHHGTEERLVGLISAFDVL